MREPRDPVSPASLRPSFKGVFGPLQRGKALEAMTCLDGHSVVARAGTGYVSSKTLHGASCLPKHHRASLFKQVQAAEHEGRVTHYARHDRTRKNQGDNLAHNDAHGEPQLSVVCAPLMMRAFLVDQAQQLCRAFFRAVWATRGSTRLLWERMRALFYAYRLDAMRALLAALLDGFAKSHPILSTDSAEALPICLTCRWKNSAIPTRHGRRAPRSRPARVFRPALREV